MPDPRTRFLSSLRPPESPAPATAWFAFRADQLLVLPADQGARLPEHDELAAVGAVFDHAHYLGRLGDADCYALDLGDAEPASGMLVEGLRGLYGRLDEAHFAIAGRAVQIVEWDRTHRFCGRCGEPTDRMTTERARRCPRCGLLSFPRLSPAVIVRILRDDRILLAHNRAFPEGLYSVLAGFVEPGETLEEAVAREVEEEVGLEVTDLRYFASQPWPYPNSLMLGFTARHADGEIRVDQDELLEADWFPRDSLPQLPGKLSIARRLIDAWLESDGS